MDVLKKLTATEVQIGDTKFYIEKLLAEEQFWLFEDLRPGLAELAPIAKGLTEKNQGELIMSVIGGVPKETIRMAMDGLMPSVKYQWPEMQMPLPVARDRGSAFRGPESPPDL